MKLKSTIFLLAAGCVLLSGCSKMSSEQMYYAPPTANEDIPPKEYDAVVTLMQTEQQLIYFQVDSVTRLYPLNYDQEYNGPKRLAGRFLEFTDQLVDGNKHYHTGLVRWCEELAKGSVKTGGESSSPDGGIDILDDWMTSLEDAFLTIHYSTFWGDQDGTQEYLLFLEKTGEAEFRLRHYWDSGENPQKGDALVYFDLNDCLPRTEGMDITLKWTTGAGENAEKSFRFRSRP